MVLTTRLTSSQHTSHTSSLTYQPTFGAITSSNNSGFLFTPRDVEIAAKIHLLGVLFQESAAASAAAFSPLGEFPRNHPS
jgi:hypothetical protein